MYIVVARVLRDNTRVQRPMLHVEIPDVSSIFLYISYVYSFAYTAYASRFPSWITCRAGEANEEPGEVE